MEYDGLWKARHHRPMGAAGFGLEFVGGEVPRRPSQVASRGGILLIRSAVAQVLSRRS